MTITSHVLQQGWIALCWHTLSPFKMGLPPKMFILSHQAPQLLGPPPLFCIAFSVLLIGS